MFLGFGAVHTGVYLFTMLVVDQQLLLWSSHSLYHDSTLKYSLFDIAAQCWNVHETLKH